LVYIKEKVKSRGEKK
jgi:hypothetical protein